MAFPASDSTQFADLFGAEALASTLSRTPWPIRREACVDLASQYVGGPDLLADVVDNVLEVWRLREQESAR